jgi:hypothetical protein
VSNSDVPLSEFFVVVVLTFMYRIPLYRSQRPRKKRFDRFRKSGKRYLDGLSDSPIFRIIKEGKKTRYVSLTINILSFAA